ncbi:MAG: hypothetical protein ACEQSB_00585 [Undibacterium sp.]
MSEQAIRALKESIKKWKKNTLATDPSEYKCWSDSCALCAIFLKRYQCFGCPIYENTKMHGCSKTPWGEASAAFDEWADSWNSDDLSFSNDLRDLARVGAVKMAEFLEDLLSEGKAN